MREQLIYALRYPRFLIKSEIPVETCHHDGHYDKQDARCVKCAQKDECEWLNDNEFDELVESKSDRELLGALAYSLNFVDAIAGAWDHPLRGCRCEACEWLRGAEKLYLQASQRPVFVN